MSERVTGLEHLGIGQNVFNWRSAPPPPKQLTKNELKYRKALAYQVIYQREKRAKEKAAMQKAATRVNLEDFSCASFTPNSVRAAR